MGWSSGNEVSTRSGSDGVRPDIERFCNKRSTEVVEANGSILFRNVKSESAEKGRSLNSRPTWP